jgi:hypothetical protein
MMLGNAREFFPADVVNAKLTELVSCGLSVQPVVVRGCLTPTF